MLRKQDLLQQKTFSFFKEHDGFFDAMFDFFITWTSNGAALFEHDEKDGSLLHIVDIENLNHLKEIYEMETNKEFI